MGSDECESGGHKAEELTAQETALYDRQIRVWGVDAQRRLSKSHIMVSGITGATAEFCKNIVLAGIGSLTLMDQQLVTEEALQANFLIPLDGTDYGEKSLAELCCNSLRDFNPMVQVSFVSGNLLQFDGEFFDKFDAVIVGHSSSTTKKIINEKCRNRPKPVAFYTVDCRDSFGEIFVDLQNYTYSKKTKDGSTTKCCMTYPSIEDAIAVPWKELPKRVTKLYFAMRVIEKFEHSNGRKYGETGVSDLSDILNLRKELCASQALNESHIPVKLLERVLAAGGKEHPPVCSIIGGTLGQEVIKAMSGKGDPIKNYYYFDSYDGKGVIEDISIPIAT
ncbi:Sumo activating enzyme 1b [Zostera marina]|uniref:Ubiquitin-like 1-activating enzyme E1A n=1 Tax=Zostera marina TaxID=29655 RepID=A0A0K9PZK8_ZOSMR|nr:Sumo activating enzyme 1b [Zostera marina]